MNYFHIIRNTWYEKAFAAAAVASLFVSLAQQISLTFIPYGTAQASTISITLQRPSNNFGLVGYWTLDGDSVAAGAGGVLDSSGNGKNGTLYGQAGGTTTVTSFTSSGSSTWTAPAGIPGVTSATVELWGGGGAGGGAAAAVTTKGGGGAGGQYAIKKVTVVPGQGYTVVVAATAAGVSNGNGTTGHDSTFNSTTVVAKGGAAGLSSGNGGTAGAGSTSSGVGDTVYAGGNGASGGAMTCATGGGAGGGGAGSTGTGNNASGNTAGAAKSLSGGAGGAGPTSSTGATGNAGATAGGGGSGGCNGSGASVRTGGGGAIGRAQITYTSPQTMPAAVPARISQGLQFSHVNGGFVSVGNVSATVNAVAFWIQVSTSTASQKIMALNGSVGLTLVNGVVTATGFTSPTIYVDDAVSSSIPDLNWHHVVVTSATQVSASAVDIGRTSAGYLGASLDDIRFYSRALIASDVNDIYHVGATSHVSTSMIGGPTLANGLKGWWTMDGKSMTSNVTDMSGNSNTGFLQKGAAGNTATSSIVSPGRIGQSVSLDGIDDDISVTASIAAIQSVSFWMKVSTSTAQQGIINLNGGTAGLTLVSGTVTAGAGFTSPVIYVDGAVSSTVNNLFWHHVVVTSTAGITASAITLGKSTNLFGGYLDDIRVYNRVLSATEVSRLYGLGQPTQVSTSLIGQGQLDSGLMGWWTFDGPYMIGNVADKSGNGNTGTLTGATTTVPGRIGQALKLSDQNAASPSYVTAPNTPSLSITTGTLAAWVKADSFGCPSTGTYCVLVSKDDGNDNQNGYEFDTRAGVLDLLLDGASSWQEAQANTTMSDGVWYHVAVSWDGSTIRFYVNGQPDGTAVQTVVPVSNVYKLIIGGGQNALSAVTPTTNAAMDDVRVYNRVLSASDIQRLYGLGR